MGSCFCTVYGITSGLTVKSYWRYAGSLRQTLLNDLWLESHPQAGIACWRQAKKTPRNLAQRQICAGFYRHIHSRQKSRSSPLLTIPSVQNTGASAWAHNTQLSGVTRKVAFAIKWRSHSQTKPGVARPSDGAAGGGTASTAC